MPPDHPTRHTITRLNHRGDGVAPGPVHIPATLPGEVVEGTVTDGRIAAPKILTPAPYRVRPPCPHARACGGCALQHASDAFVAAWKADVVRTALAAQGLHASFRPIHTSPPRTRRRATLAGRRTKKGALVGFHARASDTIVAIPGCLLLHPDLMAALPLLEAITALCASRSTTLSFTLTLTDTGLDLDISGAPSPEASRLMTLAHLVESAGLARLSWSGETISQSVPPMIAFGPARVTPPPGAFLQATADGEAALLAAVTSAVSSAIGPPATIADLFSGCGTFALPLATQARVHAVEGDAAMITALATGARQATGLRPLTTEVRDLFRRPLLTAELDYGAVVIDPPRAGAEAQCRELAQSAVPRIAAVSCNPVTFARDARILTQGGYVLDWVQVIDQFRWSAHVELAAAFSKADS